MNINSTNDNNHEIVNCLALTIKKDYNLNIVKNVANHILIDSCRISFSIFVLNFLSMFL